MCHSSVSDNCGSFGVWSVGLAEDLAFSPGAGVRDRLAAASGMWRTYGVSFIHSYSFIYIYIYSDSFIYIYIFVWQ